jgi:hypothetical protein
VPELLEVETYRELADRTVGRRIATVEAPDTWFLKGVTASQVVDALTGATVHATGRRGKLLTVEVGEGRPVLGLRFGMTGRLVLDGEAPIGQLEYASGRDDPAWDRFACASTTAAACACPTRAASAGWSWTPTSRALGPDAVVSAGQLRGAGRARPRR